MTNAAPTVAFVPATQPRLRVLGGVLLAAVLLLAAVRAVSWTVGDDLAYLDPPAALEVREDQPMALGSTAELNWALGKYAEADQWARRAVAANPLNGAGYRVLGLVAAAQGQDARAVKLVQLALRRTPGDLTARRWLAERAQAAGQWTQALELQDRLLRQSPDEGAAWFEEWTTRLQEPVVRAAMLPVLVAAPPWREAFLQHYARQAPRAPEVDALFSQMPQLSAAEATAWLARLVADGQWTAAWQRWQQLRATDSVQQDGGVPVRAAGVSAVEGVSGTRLVPSGQVVNGGFEATAGLPPFDWTLRAPAGIQLAQAPAPGRPGQALRLQFLGTRAAFNGVQQTVLLAAGQHQLRWAYQLEALQTPRGLRWVAACAGTGEELGASPLLAGQTAWREGTFVFEVPAGCPAVALRLELAARIAAETQAYGTAWFDDVRLND
jgi:tetratricopeptide (TPR) repeat protein